VNKELDCGCLVWMVMRNWVCLLYMLLVLASAVFLTSVTLGTQIWDFPFHRLIWLAGSRWRHLNPPPHGPPIHTMIYSLYILWHDAWKPEQWSQSKCLLPANGWMNTFPSATRIGIHCYTMVLVTIIYCTQCNFNCWKLISMATNCWKHSSRGMW
jgi:hypothetical protein